MKLKIILASAFLALAGCSGSGLGLGGDEGDEGGVGGGGGGGGGGGDDTCVGVFICGGDVLVVSYDAGTDTLSITGTPFDETPLAATYVRAGADINGIPTYMNDESPFNTYTAYYTESAGGEIAVGATGIDGYQDYGYGGTFVLLSDPATPPTTGLGEFSGAVAGLVAYLGQGTLDTSTGDILMQVDFTDNRIKGFVTGRTFSGGLGTTPTSLVLNDTTIVGGSFTGTVNSYTGPETIETGTYSGYFAGGSGDYIGGTYEAINGDYATDVTSRDTGVFIATSCGGICP